MLRRGGLRRAAKAAHYGLVVLAAYAAAVVVVRAADLEFDPGVPSDREAADASAAVASEPNRAADHAVILRRNLFGASSIESEDDGPTPAGMPDLRLRGIAASRGGASFAVFENTATSEQNVFAVGDKVFDGPRLLTIDATGADVLWKGRKRRYLVEEEAEEAGRAGRRKGAPAKAVPAKAGAKAAAGEGVRRTGEGTYLVDRREVEHTVANLNEVITQARAVPVLKDGKSSGFKLFNIRPGSIFQKLGLKDGDIVQRVNDTELTDPSRAIGLLEEVQSMGEIQVNFLRGNKPLSYRYSIR